jgi:transcriptional regulator with XRE-family HTH domain
VPRPPKDLSPGSGPLALWGSELRRFRELSGLSQDAAGNKIPVSGSHIGALERGESRTTPQLAAQLDQVVDARGSLIALWEKLILNSAFPTWFDWPKHESEAVQLQTFQSTVVYGLLQTEAYASALLRSDETAVAARMDRQTILAREDPPPPFLSVLMDESVLHRKVGDAKMMHEQLQHLVESVSRRVSIQVVPCEVHDGLSGSFVLATMRDRSEVAYMDTAVKALTLASNEDLTTINESLVTLRAQALSVRESLDLINRMAEGKWT